MKLWRDPAMGIHATGQLRVKSGHSSQHHSMTALPPKADMSVPRRQELFEYTPLIHYRVEQELSPPIGTFGQTGTLADLVDRFSPARLSLLYALPRGLGDLSGDVLLILFPLLDDIAHGFTRTCQRFRCLKVGNRLSRSLTTLAVFVIAGKIGVASSPDQGQWILVASSSSPSLSRSTARREKDGVEGW